MAKLNKDFFSSPPALSFAYLLLSGLAIMIFRYIFPGEPVPLECFSSSWRLVQGFLEYAALFPALALSSLVIPFGLNVQTREKDSQLSSRVFRSLKSSIISAIAVSALYAFLFMFALPLARNYRAELLSQSHLYLLAKEHAEESAASRDWTEVLSFAAICEKIWPENREIALLKAEAEIRNSQDSLSSAAPPAGNAEEWDMDEAEPVNASDALAQAQSALAEERYFDAHWLATLAARLSKPGSPELAAADRLAGRAWSGINDLAPNAMESRAFNLFRLKREGYEALIGGEWIRSYYIFQDLLKELPDDPDVAKYFALSEEGVKSSAFFADEIELTLGKIQKGAVFSVPLGTTRDSPDRAVIRLSSLSTSADCAYGIEAEIMAFDRAGLPLWSMKAPYVKILPYNLDSGPALVLFLRALDRADSATRWEPEITDIRQSPPHASEITLPLDWNTFLLLSNVHRGGLSGLSVEELNKAAANLGSLGYLPQVFEAEMLARFARPLFLLPLAIFTIKLGWQYRARKRSRYIALPMLGILPLVFSGLVFFCRIFLNRLGILAVVSLGFNAAALCFAAGIVLALILSLILLASAHD